MFLPADTVVVAVSDVDDHDDITRPQGDRPPLAAAVANPFEDERTQCYSDEQIAALKNKIGSRRPPRRPTTLIPAEDYFAQSVDEELTVAAPVELLDPDFADLRFLAPEPHKPLPAPPLELALGSLSDAHTAEHIATQEAMQAAERAAIKALWAAEQAAIEEPGAPRPQMPPPGNRSLPRPNPMPQRSLMPPVPVGDEVPWFVRGDGQPREKFPSMVPQTLVTIPADQVKAMAASQSVAVRFESQPLRPAATKSTARERLLRWLKR